MSTHEAIEPKYMEYMNALASTLDEIFNGDERPKKVGFCLLVFDFESEGASDRINYISNAARKEMLCALKEIVSRFEGRHIEETGTPKPGEQ